MDNPQDQAGGNPTNPATPPRTSTWAMVSLLCSAALCCPPMMLLGPLFGLRALVEIKANPGSVGGRKLALWGIGVGVVGFILWVVLALLWQVHAREPMIHGPDAALRAGFAGDIATFKSHFTSAGVSATDDEARAFLDELTLRYGIYLDSDQATGSQAAPVTLSGSTTLRIRYTLLFDQRPANIEAAFVTFGPANVIPNPIFNWAWIRVLDPQRGDLIYPSSAKTEALTTQPSTTQPATTQPTPSP